MVADLRSAFEGIEPADMVAAADGVALGAGPRPRAGWCT